MTNLPGLFLRKLQCRVLHIHYDFSKRRGFAAVFTNHEVDMTGTIEFFTAIDPGVTQIIVMSGKKLMQVYSRDKQSGSWQVGEPK